MLDSATFSGTHYYCRLYPRHAALPPRSLYGLVSWRRRKRLAERRSFAQLLGCWGRILCSRDLWRQWSPPSTKWASRRRATLRQSRLSSEALLLPSLLKAVWIVQKGMRHLDLFVCCYLGRLDSWMSITLIFHLLTLDRYQRLWSFLLLLSKMCWIQEI